MYRAIHQYNEPSMKTRHRMSYTFAIQRLAQSIYLDSTWLLWSPFSMSPTFCCAMLISVCWPTTADSKRLPRFSGPKAVVTAIPSAIMAVMIALRESVSYFTALQVRYSPIVGPYAGTLGPPTAEIEMPSAMALTICALGEEIMLPSW
jgi:hypothetical protein